MSTTLPALPAYAEKSRLELQEIVDSGSAKVVMRDDGKLLLQVQQPGGDLQTFLIGETGLLRLD